MSKPQFVFKKNAKFHVTTKLFTHESKTPNTKH